MKVLAIDPGLVTCGWASLRIDRNKDGKTVYCAACGSRDGKRIAEARRVEAMSVFLEQLVERERPELVCVEKWVYQGPRSHGKSGLGISALCGCIQTICRVHKVPLVELSRNEVLGYFGLSGKTPKGRMRTVVEACIRGDAELPNEHVVDAVAVGIAGESRWSVTRAGAA